MVQKMHVCVIDIGNSRVKLALFKEDKLTKTYAKSHDFDFETHLPPLLLSENIKTFININLFILII
jgi:pantothenate kinase type III